jgi:quercetin dioxygenase-like cupin family protein
MLPFAMRFLTITALFAVLSAGWTHAQPTNTDVHVEITPLAERPSVVGPSDLFTGTVLIGPLFDPDEARAFGGATVTFFPGARTNWHSHPAGQTLVVTEGVGWVQTRGGERREIRPGDVVWTPPGVEHWHGATAEHAMTHLALYGAEDGEVVTWLEPVTDEQYQSNTTTNE